MGYELSTPNLKLPIYQATDRPSYLGDWNEAMGNIDTGYGAVTDIGKNVSALETTVAGHTNSIAGINSNIASINGNINTINGNIATINSNNKTPYGAKAVMFGDSNTLGTYVTSPLITLIKNAFGMSSAVNYGVSNATFLSVSGHPQVIAQINAQAADTTVDYVFLFGGINDYHYSNMTAEQFGTAVLDTIAAAHVKYPSAIIVTLFDGGHQYPNSLMYRYQAAMMGAATAYPTLNVPMADLCMNDSLWYNQNHYNNAGLSVIMQRIYATLVGGRIVPMPSKVEAATSNHINFSYIMNIDPFILRTYILGEITVGTDLASQGSINSGTVLFTFPGNMLSSSEFKWMPVAASPGTSIKNTIPLGFSNGSNNGGVITSGGPTVVCKAAYTFDPSTFGAVRGSMQINFNVSV